MSLNDFFKPIGLLEIPSDNDYKSVQAYIDAIKVISHIAYQSIYIVDYYKREFAYVSDNPLFLCGESPVDVQKQGWLFYFNHVHKDDIDLLLKINEAGFKFYNQLPIEERLEYIISYDFRIKQRNNHSVLINHKLAPLVLDKSSNIWLAVCYVSASSNRNSGNVIIHKVNSDMIIEYDIDTGVWKQRPRIKLTKIEKEILLLSSQGLKIAEIAKSMFIAISTVKSHRTNILKKLNVDNIGGAIVYAANNQLI